MTTTNLALGQNASFTLGAVDGTTPPVARAANLIVTIPDTSLAFLAARAAQIFVIAAATGSVTLTITGTAASGAALPPVTMQFVITATPPAPDAVAITETPVVVNNNDITIPSSGVASLTVSV